MKKKKNKLSQSLSLLLSPARSRPRQTAKECNVTAWSHTSSIAYLAEDAFTCTSGAGPRAGLTVRGVVLSRRAGSAVRKLEMGLGGGREAEMLIAHPCPSGILPENHPFLVHCTSYASMQGHWQGCLLSLSLSPSLSLTLSHSPSPSLSLSLSTLCLTHPHPHRPPPHPPHPHSFIHMPDHATIIAPFFVLNARPPPVMQCPPCASLGIAIVLHRWNG